MFHSIRERLCAYLTHRFLQGVGGHPDPFERNSGPPVRPVLVLVGSNSSRSDLPAVLVLLEALWRRGRRRGPSEERVALVVVIVTALR
jgi:hypothetical protein